MSYLMTLKNINGPNRNRKQRKKDMLISSNTKTTTQELIECQTGSSANESPHIRNQIKFTDEEIVGRPRSAILRFLNVRGKFDQGVSKNATVWDRTRWSWRPHYTSACRRVKLVVFVDRTHQTQNESGRTSSFSNVHV